MEHFKIDRKEILDWPYEFYLLAIWKLNVDGEIREKAGKE